jgi:hypothetical protein
MDSHDLGALSRFVKEHHVHYEIEPETVVQRDRREVVGYEVRLFATHGEARLRAPGCRECAELVGELRSFAERLVVPGHAAAWTGTLAASPALYQSSEVLGADEVAITMRVHCDSPDHQQTEAGGRRCMDEIRERLGEAGIPRR